ncbi:MAG: ribosome recycling factor [Bacilli bacterium]
MEDIKKVSTEKMGKCVENLKGNLCSLRTGVANAAILSDLMCDYYGDKISVTSIAAVKVPEPRQLLVVPYDANDVKTIVDAINKSDIGINPIIDGHQIRLVIPSLTEDRRKELVKKAKGYGEEAKVSIRNVRREVLDSIKNDDGYSEDMRKNAENDVQKVTDDMCKSVDSLIKVKETEIMSI